jgi:hypothetical protein
MLSRITQQISAPVLVVIGAHSATDTCGPPSPTQAQDCASATTILHNEEPFYPPAAMLRACSVPGSGHDISLALNHAVLDQDALAWAREYVGQRGLGRHAAPGPDRKLPSNCA